MRGSTLLLNHFLAAAAEAVNEVYAAIISFCTKGSTAE